MAYYGYNRVSTAEQHLDRGRKAIQDFCQSRNVPLVKIYEDKQTGRNFDRPRYIVLKEDVLRSGDTLIVPEYDRLGRANETRDELEYFKAHGIRVIFLDIPTTQIELSGMADDMSRMVLDCINNMLIQFYDLMARTELERKTKRQREGIEAKKARGEWDDYGRPRRMDKAAFAAAYETRVLRDGIGSNAFMRELCLPSSTYHAYLREYKATHGEEK